MREQILVVLLIILALPAIAAAQDRITGEIGAGGAYFLEEEYSGFFNGYLVTAGISYRGLGIQGELWKSGDETVSGLSLNLSPLYKSTFSPYFQGGFLVGSEGGWALAFGGGLRIRFAKFMGLRAEIRFTGPFGIVSGGIFVRI